MSLQLRIVHTTGYTYDGQAGASFNEARMTPQSSTGQIVVHSRLDVHPSPWVYTYRDYWGSQVTAFEVFEPHETLTVTSTATVQVDRGEPGAPTSTWEDLREPELSDRLAEFLDLPERVEPPAELVERAHGLLEQGGSPGQVAREVCRLVHDEMNYLPGSTSVATTAAEAWDRRSGVCQDLAHLVIGTLRALGIPARYVSGYLHPDTDAPLGEAVTGQSHAWVSWWDGSWVDFDPTNLEEVGDHHVLVAAGRDYADVRPLSGIYAGSDGGQMFVDVQITRLQ